MASHYIAKSGKTSVVEASDVLREILKQKIPTGTGHSYNSYHPATGPMKYEKQVFSQHTIPTDPYPPPFRPLKNNNYLPPLYGLSHGPIESVTHSQSITTSFGGSLNSPYIDETDSQFPPSYDIYRSMSVKMSGKKENTISHSHSSQPDPRSKGTYTISSEYLPSTKTVSLFLSPPKSTALTDDRNSDDNQVHQQQLHDLSLKLGPGIEVQKSLAYELDETDRSSKQTPTKQDSNRRRPGDKKEQTSRQTRDSSSSSTKNNGNSAAGREHKRTKKIETQD